MAGTSIRYRRALLSTALVILLLAFGVNAYACLLPIYGGAMTEPGSACSSPHEQPARQFCEHFKTLGIQAAPDFPSPTDDAAVVHQQALPSASLCRLQAGHLAPPQLRGTPPPHEPQVRCLVLRL